MYLRRRLTMSNYDENDTFRFLKKIKLIKYDPYRIYYLFGPHYTLKRMAVLKMLQYAEGKYPGATIMLNDLSYNNIKDDIITKHIHNICGECNNINELIYLYKVYLEIMRKINYGDITIFPESYDYICHYLSKIAYIGKKCGHPLPADDLVEAFEALFYDSPITKYILEKDIKFTFIFMKIRDKKLLSSHEYRNMIKDLFGLPENDDDIYLYNNIYLNIYRYVTKRLRTDLLECYAGYKFTFYDSDFDVELVMGS